MAVSPFTTQDFGQRNRRQLLGRLDDGEMPDRAHGGPDLEFMPDRAPGGPDPVPMPDRAPGGPDPTIMPDRAFQPTAPLPPSRGLFQPPRGGITGGAPAQEVKAEYAQQRAAPPSMDPNWLWGIGPGATNPDELNVWRAVSSGGFNPNQGLTPAVLQALQQYYPGATIADAGSGSISVPGRGTFDVIRNLGGGNAQWWIGGHRESDRGGEAPVAPTLPTAPVVPVLPPREGGGEGEGGGKVDPRPTALDDFRQQIRTMLLARMKDLQQPFDPNAPEIAGPTKAAERALERERQNRRSAMAERLAQENLLGSGAFDASVESGFEDKANTLSNFTGNLTAQAIQQRRQELLQILNLGTGFLNAQDEQALRRELSQLDAQLRREQMGLQRYGMNQQNTQFYDQLGLQRYGMGLQNQQFNDQLGFNIGALQAELNRLALLGALG